MLYSGGAIWPPSIRAQGCWRHWSCARDAATGATGLLKLLLRVAAAKTWLHCTIVAMAIKLHCYAARASTLGHLASTIVFGAAGSRCLAIGPVHDCGDRRTRVQLRGCVAPCCLVWHGVVCNCMWRLCSAATPPPTQRCFRSQSAHCQWPYEMEQDAGLASCTHATLCCHDSDCTCCTHPRGTAAEKGVTQANAQLCHAALVYRCGPWRNASVAATCAQVAQLQDMLVTLGLPKSGTKAVLIDRLLKGAGDAKTHIQGLPVTSISNGDTKAVQTPTATPKRRGRRQTQSEDREVLPAADIELEYMSHGDADGMPTAQPSSPPPAAGKRKARARGTTADCTVGNTSAPHSVAQTLVVAEGGKQQREVHDTPTEPEPAQQQQKQSDKPRIDPSPGVELPPMPRFRRGRNWPLHEQRGMTGEEVGACVVVTPESMLYCLWKNATVVAYELS